MDDCKFLVGLDYHQASVQLCVLASNGQVLCNRSLPNESAVLVTVAEQFGEVADGNRWVRGLFHEMRTLSAVA